MAEVLEIVAAVLASITSSTMILVSDRRLRIGLLGFQYLAVFLLVQIEWSLIQALTILISGWIAGVVLGMAESNISINRLEEVREIEKFPSINPVFKILSSAVIGLIAFSLVFQVMNLIPELDSFQSWTALLLIGLGVLYVTFETQPISMTLGLLTILSGFEIFYSGLTSSVLTLAFLSGITLFLALTGTYLFLAPMMEDGS
jgi:hypothetical protein